MELFDELDVLGSVIRSGLSLSPYATLPAGHQWVPHVQALAQAKTSKEAEINAWRLAANDEFSHLGLSFSADALSWKDIIGIQAYVAEAGALPAVFPGGWKARDGSVLPISTLGQWQAFYASAMARGAATFAHSEALKAALSAAQTLSEVAAITW